MKVAIASDGERVAKHFGHCREYTLYGVEDKEIKGREKVKNPGHRPDFLPGFLRDLGVHCIIAGGMGHRAIALFKEHDIVTIIGVEGEIEKVMEKYLSFELHEGDNACHH